MGSNPVQVTIRNKSLIQEKLESVFLFHCAYDHMFINKKSTFQDLFSKRRLFFYGVNLSNTYTKIVLEQWNLCIILNLSACKNCLEAYTCLFLSNFHINIRFVRLIWNRLASNLQFES